MENWDIPYFEGMQSVKMPVLTTYGKNIFDGQVENNKEINGNTGVVSKGGRTIPVNFIKVEPNTTYTFTRPVAKGNIGIRYYSVSQGFMSSRAFTNYTGKFSATFTTPSNCYFVKFIDEANTLEKGYQIECGSAATPYEPYKTNILTVNEEVELRGIGDVRDELDLLSGEVTERIGEIVLDGVSIIPTVNRMGNQNNTIAFDFKKSFPSLNSSLIHSLNDTFPDYSGDDLFMGDVEGLSRGWDAISVRINKNRLAQANVEGFKQWLQSNPITVQYQLKTPTIKTVDLKVVNQDGNQVKELSAFDGTTYIVSGSASDNSLIAITEVEVPTKLIEVLDGVKSLSSDVEILINEVDNTQKLQDENSTMAMSAMTELYEMILMMGGND